MRSNRSRSSSSIFRLLKNFPENCGLLYNASTKRCWCCPQKEIRCRVFQPLLVVHPQNHSTGSSLGNPEHNYTSELQHPPCDTTTEVFPRFAAWPHAPNKGFLKSWSYVELHLYSQIKLCLMLVACHCRHFQNNPVHRGFLGNISSIKNRVDCLQDGERWFWKVSLWK